jgi:RimJ/RimL family protein N-acetyltransferase
MATIRGEHVLLRSLTVADGELIYRWLEDTEFRREFQAWPMSLASCQDWARARVEIGFRTGAHFVICTPDERPIGYTALRQPSRAHRRAELVFAVCDPDARRRGLASEAARLTCRFGFKVMELERIYAWVLPYKKWILDRAPMMGFAQEVVAREHVWFEGAYSDMVLISVLSGEFVDRDPRRLFRDQAAEALFRMVREVLDRDLPAGDSAALLTERVRRAGGLRSVRLCRADASGVESLLGESGESGTPDATVFRVPVLDGEREVGSLQVELDEDAQLTRPVADLLTRLAGELVSLLRGPGSA